MVVDCPETLSPYTKDENVKIKSNGRRATKAIRFSIFLLPSDNFTQKPVINSYFDSKEN